MDSRKLTADQADRMVAGLAPGRRYISKLKARMEQRKFPADDKLYVLTLEAQRALQDLFVELHYLSCQSGVGREARE